MSTYPIRDYKGSVFGIAGFESRIADPGYGSFTAENAGHVKEFLVLLFDPVYAAALRFSTDLVRNLMLTCWR